MPESPPAANAVALSAASAPIGANYGANLSLLPPVMKDLRGPKNFGVNYGPRLSDNPPILKGGGKPGKGQPSKVGWPRLMGPGRVLSVWTPPTWSAPADRYWPRPAAS